jgi:uncharacterized protein with beta-barrel porin domain
MPDRCLNAGGTITGGLNNGGGQANAIVLTGGTNAVGPGGTITGGIQLQAGSLAPALPGSAIGPTLAVNGPVSFAAGSTYAVRIAGAANDSITATGAATIGGASVASTITSFTLGQKNTILTASAINGTFASPSSNSAFVSTVLSYDPTHVFESILGNAGGGSAINFTTVAQTQNQFNFAVGLNNAGTLNGIGGPILGAISLLSAPQARAVFDALDGEGITGAQNLALGMSHQFTATITDQTVFFGSSGAVGSNASNSFASSPRPPITTKALPAPLPSAPEWRVWASGFGAGQTISGDPGAGFASQSNTIAGGALGVDYRFWPSTLIGFATGGSDGYFSVNDRATSGSTTGGHVAIYLLTSFGQAYLQGTTSASFFDNSTTRAIAGFGALGAEVEHASFASHEFRSRYEVGYRFNVFSGVLTPFTALEWARLYTNGFTETPAAGAGLFALSVAAQTIDSVPFFAGARWTNSIAVGNGMWLTPSLQAAWVHEFDPVRNQTGALVNLPGALFLTNGAQPASDAAELKAGAELLVRANVRLSANFEGEFSNRGNTYAGKGAVKVSW